MIDFTSGKPLMENRLWQHNNHHFKNSFTKAATDCRLKLEFSLKNRKEALYLERFLKRMKSKTFIKKIVDNPQILKDIFSKR